jgi:EmrB/QacA subfamily drug resistance transporter
VTGEPRDAPGRRAGAAPGQGRTATDDLTIEAPGADEVAVLPWPILLRERVRRRVAGSPRYPWIVLAVSLYGLFSVTITITILSVSVPEIARDLGSDSSTVTWVITGPILAFAVLGPAAGKLGDLHGHRRVYLISLSFVALFAALAAVSWSAGSLIAFRVLGAAAGAAVGPASIAMINRLFAPERRVQAMGYWSMVAAGGPVIGVVAGGPVVETFGWRWIFVGQAPITVGGLLLALVLLPETERRVGAQFDVAGAVTLAVAATSALYAINRGPVVGWDHPTVLGGFVLSPLALVAFLAVERRVEHPLLPLTYLRRRNFSCAIATQCLIQFAYMGGFIITPLMLDSVFGYTETRIGGLMIARPLAFAVAGPLAGYLAVRIGERTSAVTGATAVVLSMLALSTVAPGSSDLVIVGALALSGIGLGASSPALAASVANAVDERDLGVAGAFQQMMTQLGVVVGIQVMQTVSVVREESVGPVDAFGEAYLVGAGVAGVGLLCSVFVRSSRRDRGGRAEGAPQGALVGDPEPGPAR